MENLYEPALRRDWTLIVYADLGLLLVTTYHFQSHEDGDLGE
jgi:hypothetical protein